MRGLILSMMYLLLIAVCASGQNAFESSGITKKVHEGTIVFKVKQNQASGFLRMADTKSPIERVSELGSVKSVNSLIPKTSLLRAESSKSGIERIYFVDIDQKADVEKLLKEVNEWPDVEYAEPLYENELLYIPNDPMANPNSGSQYHLKNIKAYEAWNIEKGDTNVVVGVVDTGADLDHADLLPNIALNHADPVNGLDDDNDGYVDNYYGWDLSDNDATPNTDVNGHGDVVSGVTNASTGNGIGVAGIGFNTRFMPVKILHNATGKLRDEYFGIIYAVDHGCKVINLSWGSPNSYTQFGQDIINYAVLDNDVVVVAAAGNTHSELNFYPASYDNVLSVAASGSSDAFASWATYSYKIDVMAPGENIVSTASNGNYGNGGNGTSFASPMVAGAAALVRSKYPELDARQVMELIRVSTDDVSGIGNNSQFSGMIGRGRLNIERALKNISSPAVRLDDYAITGNFGDYFFAGDTVTISTKFLNYLSKTANLKITIEAIDDKIVGAKKVYDIGVLDTYELADKSDDVWKVVIADHVEPYSRIIFKVTYEADGYTDYEHFEFRTTPWYFDVENNDLLLTIASDGDLAYDNDYFTYGNGFRYKYERIAHSLGLIISQNENYVADNIINSFQQLTKDKDFEEISYARLYSNSIADIDARSAFKESEYVSKKGLSVEQKILGWNENPSDDFFILEYRLVNESDSILSDLNLSFYADWELENRYFNASAFDDSEGLLYTYDKINNNLFAGISVLTSGDSTYAAIDLENYNGNTAELGSYFSDTIKYEYSAGLRGKKTAGAIGSGNNVANMAGLKNISLAPGQSKKIAFVLMAGNSLTNLIDELNSAKAKYKEYLDHPPLAYQTSVCYGDQKELFPTENASQIEVYGDPYHELFLGSGSSFVTGSLKKDTTFYVTNIKNGISSDIQSVNVVLRAPKADFFNNNDTLYISGSEQNSIKLLNQSIDAAQYSWDFDNGFFSTVKDPLVKYEFEGDYSIRLAIKNDIGCFDSTTKTLHVIARSGKPIVKNQTICAESSATISADNSSLIRVYEDEALTNLLSEGTLYNTPVLSQSKNYYVTNAEGVESLPERVTVNVSSPNVDFDYGLHYAMDSHTSMLQVVNLSQNAKSLKWSINEVTISDMDTALYDFSDSDNVTIVLTAYDSLGCQAKKELLVTPQISEKPVDEIYPVCVNSTLELNPTSGNDYFLYRNFDDAEPVAFGESFVIGPVKKDTVLYISNADNLLESEKAEIQIKLKVFRANVTARPETIDLSETNQVSITDISKEASFTYWLSETGSIDTSGTMVVNIYQPGTYQYTLIAKNAENCTDTAVATINAYLLTGLEEGYELMTERNELKVYPNPANDRINLSFDNDYQNFNRVELIDLSGKVHFDKEVNAVFTSELEINSANLLNGIYLLRLHGDSNTETIKIAVAH